MGKRSSKKPWVFPSFEPDGLGAMNKFGASNPCIDYINAFEGISIKELIDTYGSPLFVTSEKKLRANVKRISSAFRRHWPDFVHGWSYKTNYTSAICNIIHQEGSWAEVVSSFEYEKARSLGIPGNRIIFNGPNKPRAILSRAIDEGAKIHIDHFDEMTMIEDIAREKNLMVHVTIRMNFETGYTEPWSRFGFNLESGQALEAVSRIAKSQYLKLTGLHSHIGTFVLDPRAHATSTRIMCQFMKKIEEMFANIVIDSIDIGGGFPSCNALQGIYLQPEQAVPDIEEYAEQICNMLKTETAYRAQKGLKLPRLIIESGRAIVDDSQVLLSSVVGTKMLPDGRRSAVLDAGANLLFTAFWYNHSVKLTKPPVGPVDDTVLYGPLCMNIDIVRKSVQLPPLTMGDTLMIGPVGAYNNTQWMQFIEYRPAIVLIHADGKHSVIRRAENLEVMTGQDVIPRHLSDPFACPVDENACPAPLI
ncbi:MAG: alanine racemase [Legionellales bacterium]|nr:alanine racemase [Legionellales bacterium]